MTTDAEYNVIAEFLRRAESRIDTHAGRIPFKPEHGKLVLAWLRGRLKDGAKSKLELETK